MIAVVALASGEAWSQEARCTALGANCICSEPFQTMTYVEANQDGTSRAWNPADSTTKQCAQEGLPGSAFTFSGTTLGTRLFATTAAQDPVMFAALPPAHTNTFVLREQEGVQAAFQPGHSFAAGTPGARLAIRAYVYISPNTVFSEDNLACNNVGKIFQWFDTGPTVSNQNANGGFHAYGWSGALDGFANGWNLRQSFPFDCCVIGPGGDANALNHPTSFWKGKWWRIEGIVENPGGTPTVLKLYLQDVTTVPRPAEIKMIDSSVATVQPVGDSWTSTQVNTATRSNPIGNPSAPLWFDLFRVTNGQDPSPVCTGFYGITHMMAAAWSTNAGQRIGAATEIEGGGGTPTPPAAPSNLRRVEWLRRFFSSVTGGIGSLQLAAIGGLLVLGRRRG